MAHNKEVHMKGKIDMHKCTMCDKYESPRRTNVMQHIKYVQFWF